MPEAPKTTNPYFDAILQLVFMVSALGAGAWGFIKWSSDRARVRITEAQEKSVGKTAIDALEKEIEKLKEAYRAGQIKEEAFHRILHDLEKDYDFILERLWELGERYSSRRKPRNNERRTN